MRSAPFEVQLNARSGGDEKSYSFRSAHGVEQAETVKPEEVLLLQGTGIENTSAVLCVDSRIGVTGCVLGDQVGAGRLMMTESEARASLVSELNRRRNEVDDAEVMLSADLKEDLLRKYDVAAYVPKRTDPDHVVRQKIFEISTNMREESKMYFSSDRETADSFRDFLEQFGAVSEKVNNNCKLLEVDNPGSPRDDGFLQEKFVSHALKGVEGEFRVLEGFFSGEEMNAVEMLGREVEADEEERLLDLSCGFGGAGIFAALLDDVNPVFVDRNAYMKDLVEDNCKRNNVEEFDVYTEDGAENFDTASFDRILYRIELGKSERVVEEDLSECRRVLKPGGELLVCHRRSFDVSGLMETLFGDFEVRRREVDHQVSVSVK